MSEVVRKRLLLAMTVSALALAVMTWGSIAPAQEAADPAAGGESALGEDGAETGGLPDDAGVAEPTDGGEVTIDDGWEGETEITIDDGWVGDDVITIDDGWADDVPVSEEEGGTPPVEEATDDGWVEDPATSGPDEGIPEETGIADPDVAEFAPEVMTVEAEVMPLSGLPEVRRDFAEGAVSTVEGRALPAARGPSAAGEGCRAARKDEGCIAP